ncbi:hypothetical protein COLO4_37610 [Corchorus olitorius]|uniref:Uncharacterized protein n=1 Tax=Corchorus olitorius TaxID=93759 RepID=A0A1R3G0R1_9ROSI|nr:hypothetical protein COLO4_37610 [Corchorus olitorius]
MAKIPPKSRGIARAQLTSIVEDKPNLRNV